MDIIEPEESIKANAYNELNDITEAELSKVSKSLDDLDIIKDDSDEINNHFINVIEKFCTSLVLFAQYVITPTVGSTHLISKKNRRSNNFDIYVLSVEDFNNIMYEIIELLKNVVIALNKVFVTKELHELTEFIETLRIFLLFLLNKNIFDILNKLQKTLNDKYKKDILILNKITKIKFLIFRICTLSTDITGLFIPPLLIIKEAIVILERKTDDMINKKYDDIKQNNIKLDLIIKQLLDLQLRSQIISSLNIKKIFTHQLNKNDFNVLRIIENLQSEYIELLYLTHTLKSEINIYKNKKKNVISNLMNKVFG